MDPVPFRRRRTPPPTESTPSPRHCERCPGAVQYRQRSFSELELRAIDELTGIVGERDGRPIVRAVLLPRRQFKKFLIFSGMTKPDWVDYEVPAFACPWGPASSRHVIQHGPAWRTDGGEICEFAEDARDGADFLFHRSSHCAIADFPAADGKVPGNYWVRAIAVAWLPRRLIGAC